LPAFRMDDADPREPLEARLAVLRDELRASALHGAVFSSAPGIVTGGHPGPTFLLRMLFGGADAVSVEGFDEGVPAAGMGTVHLDAVGVDVLPGLQGGRPVLDRADRPAGGALSPEGIPLRPWFMLRRHAPLLRRFAGAVGHWDHPLWWGSGGGDGPVEVLEPAVGAVGEPPQEPDATPAQGAVELFSDHFMEWYVAPPEAGATRTSYMMQAADGTILLPLLSLEGLEDGAGSGEREDLITKLVTGDQEIPRHSGLVVPSYDREGAVPPWRGWGSKLVVLEHPLGAGYPRLEYCSSHLLDIREFNTRLLLVTYGEPAVKSGGIWFTEPGELSLAAFPSLPQVEWNSLPGGGVHTDPGGRMAIQSQHSGTGALVLSLDSGKTLELLSTITEVAERLSFHKDPKGWDLGVSGFDVVEEVAAVAEGLAVTGSRRPGDRPFVLLVHAEPWAVTLDGEPLECSYEAPALLLTCPHEEPVPPAQPSPLAAFATRQEPAGTGPLDLGAEAHPEAFVEAGTAPRPAEDALVGVDHGILWYTTELLLGGAGQDAFLSVPAAGDLVSVFVNDLYAGSSMALGNRPLAAGDASAGLGAPGFRIPAGFFHAGSNRVALRVLVWGRADRDVPRLLSMVPLLKDELLPFASAVPHLAVPGLQPFGRRGAWGAVTLQVSGAGVPLGGPWTQSAGGGGREGRTRGLLEGWHQLAPGAEPPGWGGVQAPSAEVPLVLADGASQWVSASFDRGPWSAAGEGGIDLVLEGRSLAALAWVNGAFAGSWLSDPESASQGAHSAIQAGQVVRGLRVSPEWAGEDGAAPAGRLRLPADALLPAQNRISVLLLDLSPAGEGDLELSGI
ncbi:MAG: hypothetical protein FJ098_11570, partial [Deltaproteobacteria bacterium]|nr:hypothetical protein [Deltaproteobacteria bacterium]